MDSVAPVELCEICANRCVTRQLDKENSLFVCSSCGHIHRDLVNCPAHARQHSWGGVGLFDKLRLQLTWMSLRRQLRKKNCWPPADVFEIGFGTGILLTKFMGMGVRVQGSERGMLERQLPNALAGTIVLHSIPAEELDLADNSFDLVYGVHVIEHLLKPEIVFAKAYSSLREGGRIYFVTPNGASKGLSLFGSAWWLLEDPSHLRFFTPESAMKALERAGFVDVEVRVARWDSLAAEASSLIRLFHGKEGKHGILDHYAARAVVMMLIPVFFLWRIVVPGMSPSIEIVGRRQSAMNEGSPT